MEQEQRTADTAASPPDIDDLVTALETPVQPENTQDEINIIKSPITVSKDDIQLTDRIIDDVIFRRVIQSYFNLQNQKIRLVLRMATILK